jgi:hypothetical protein
MCGEDAVATAVGLKVASGPVHLTSVKLDDHSLRLKQHIDLIQPVATVDMDAKLRSGQPIVQAQRQEPRCELAIAGIRRADAEGRLQHARSPPARIALDGRKNRLHIQQAHHLGFMHRPLDEPCAGKPGKIEQGATDCRDRDSTQHGDVLGCQTPRTSQVDLAFIANPSATAARRNDVEAPAAAVEHPPRRRSAGATEHRTFSARKNRPEPPAIDRDQRMPHGIHARKERVQSATRHPMPGASLTQAASVQLGKGDDTLLQGRQPCHCLINLAGASAVRGHSPKLTLILLYGERQSQQLCVAEHAPFLLLIDTTAHTQRWACLRTSIVQRQAHLSRNRTHDRRGPHGGREQSADRPTPPRCEAGRTALQGPDSARAASPIAPVGAAGA